MKTISEILALGPGVPSRPFDGRERCAPRPRAFAAGGLPGIEVTRRTAGPPAAIKAIAAEVPEAVVGAGTILNPSHYEEAVTAGALFIVSPGSTPPLIAYAKESKDPFLPGAAPASEAMVLPRAGFPPLKSSPAEPAGGTKMLASLAPPLPALKFCPTGGISVEKAPEYLALPNVPCVGGSWVAPADAVKAHDWGKIEALARAAAGFGEKRGVFGRGGGGFWGRGPGPPPPFGA